MQENSGNKDTCGSGDYSFIYCAYYYPWLLTAFHILFLSFFFNTAIPWAREYYSYFLTEEIEQEWPSN